MSARIQRRKKPRRRGPRQDRSRATVDAILRATAHILAKEGYERASTNRIASRAGVSIGSLYQYFPNKEALARALIDQLRAQIEAVLTPDLALLAEPLPVVARALVEGMLKAHAVNPPLHTELVRVSDLLGVSLADALHQRGVALVKGLLGLHAGQVRKLDPELAPFIIVCTVDSVVRQATRTHREYLSRPQLADEVTAMILRYVSCTQATVGEPSV